MKLGDFDRSGRRAPTASKQEPILFEANQVIIAIGQRMDPTALFGKNQPELNSWGFVKADPTTGETSMPGIFSGGDAVDGPSSVVRAIAAGERAAAGMDLMMTGEDHAFWRWEQKLDTDYDPDADPVPYPREKLPVLSRERRRYNFDEVERPWNEHTAIRQAKRCLRCDYGKNVRMKEESHA